MITLHRINEDKKLVIKNLLHEYLLELLPNENPEYKFLDSYWQEVDRHPFFILFESEIAGFILINKVHTIPQSPTPHSIAEFYILPEFRKKGIGKAAAIICFKQYPGTWEVQQFSNNLDSIQFWRNTISQYTNGLYQEFDDENSGRIIQIFNSIPFLNIN